MRQPSDYENADIFNFVCKLDKTFYSLKQAPRACFSRLSTKLHGLGFATSRASDFYIVLPRAPSKTDPIPRRRFIWQPCSGLQQWRTQRVVQLGLGLP